MATVSKVAQRRWRLLLLLAAQGGWYTTDDVEALTGASSMVVHRDLNALHKSGLLRRKMMDGDRSHRWLYAATPAGEQRVADVLERAGLDVPVNLGIRAGARAKYLLVLLSAASHIECVGQVLAWRSGADVAWWLRHRHGIDGVQADAYGIWAEGDRAVRILVQVDDEWAHQVTDRLLDQLTATTGFQLPVNAVLLIADTAAAEKRLQRRLRDGSPIVVVATTTWDAMYGPEGPAGAIWSTVDASEPRRLIELAEVG